MTFSFISSGTNRIKHFSLKSRIPPPPRFPLLCELMSVSRTLLTFPEATKSFPQSRGLRRTSTNSWTSRNSYMHVTCHIQWERCPRLYLVPWANGACPTLPSPGQPRRSCGERLGGGSPGGSTHVKALTAGDSKSLSFVT